MVGHAAALRLETPGVVAPAARRCRVALYSHDTMGMGHRRRNLLIAQALSKTDLAPVMLTISGASDLGALGAVPAGADSLVLPALSKVPGGYQARHLDISLEELVAVRSAAIGAALDSFRPDLFIVDNVPRGAANELDRTLEALRKSRRTKCVLGLRDVLDDPETVRRQWRGRQSNATLRRYYDAIWVYGDRDVYDLTREYDLAPDIADRVRFTGYLDPRMRLIRARPDGDRHDDLAMPAGHRLALCLVGGGEDGGDLALAFARAPMPAKTTGLVVLGPYMPEPVREAVRAEASRRTDLRVIDALDEPTVLMARADRVVMMGGYNTTCEALTFGCQALVVPRVQPRTEQLIRARRLADRGLVDVLHPDALTPHAIGAWLAGPVAPRRAFPPVDMNGLKRLPDFVRDVLAAPQRPTLRPVKGGRSCR